MPDTFSYTPTWNSALDEEPKVRVAAFGDGYAQRVPDGINTTAQKWDLVFDGVTDSTADGIVTLLRNNGGATYFLWTPPGGTQIKVICKQWRRDYAGYNSNNIRCRFEQVFDL